jgi:uncharacterized protein (TIGR02118 family)
MFKVDVCYRRPEDPVEFDEKYFETHVPLVRRFPGLAGFDVSHGEVAGGEDVYLVATLSFADSETAERALSSAEAAASMENLNSFADGLYTMRSYQTRSLL